MAPDADKPIAPALFLVSVAILALEVLHVRILSVQMWYHHAYIIVTMAMLGFAVAGTVTALAPSLTGDRARGVVAWCSTAFGVCVLAAHLAINALVDAAVASQTSGAGVALAYAVLLVPYFFGGTVITVALSSGARIHRLYAVNLVGSALGAWLFIAAITPLGGERLLVLCAALGPLAALCTAPGSPRHSPVAAAAVLALAVCAALFWQEDVLRTRFGADKQKFFRGDVIDQRWTPLARLDVLEDPTNPKIKHILQDGMAGTFMHSAEHWQPRSLLNCHSLAYVPHLRRQTGGGPRPRALVIGIGGGSDLRAAVDYGVESVLGLEINEEMAAITGRDYAAYNGGVYHLPGVSVVVGEGRSTLRRLEQRFDLIQLAGADTYTAGASGAFVLSESYLYTAEALADYFDHLTPRGTLGITRFWDDPPRETLRIFGMALLELRRRGIARPSRHAVVIRDGWSGGTAFSLEPFEPGDLEIYAMATAPADPEAGREREFEALYLPGHDATRDSPYTELALAIDEGTEERFYAGYPIDLRPVTDDSPFFYNVHHFWDPVEVEDSRFAREFGFEFPVAPSILRTLLLQTSVLVLVLVVLPLLVLRRGGLREARAGRHLAFFLAVGAGFMFVEISMIQRLILFLGHPTYSLTVVLFSFLFFAGLGSLAAGRYVTDTDRGIRGAVVVLCALIVVLALALGPLTSALLHWPLGWRIACATCLLAPLNFAMGMPFPLALARLRTAAPRLVPWAIGANGGASVIGSILAVVVAMESGFTTVLLVALAIYLAGMLCVTARRAEAPA